MCLATASRIPVIDEAFEAAAELREPNRGVTVASWPLKALALCGESSRVQSEGARLLLVISQEPSPGRRADALRFLLGATASSRQPIAATIAEAFGAACIQPLVNQTPSLPPPGRVSRVIEPQRCSSTDEQPRSQCIRPTRTTSTNSSWAAARRSAARDQRRPTCSSIHRERTRGQLRNPCCR